MRRCLQLLLWWCQQVPGAAEDFVAAKGALRVQGEQKQAYLPVFLSCLPC